MKKTILYIINLRHIKILLLASILVLFTVEEIYGQNVLCKRKTDIYYHYLINIFMEASPQDVILKKQYEKLNQLDALIIDELNKNSYNIFPIPGKSNFRKQHGYIISGLIGYIENQYFIHLLFESGCMDELLTESKVYFQLYPSWNPASVAQQVVSKLVTLINIEDLEMKIRDSKNYGLGGDLWGGHISISMNNKMVNGEETKVMIKVIDCDGLVLKNKDITTKGTSGGIFTPDKFQTDDEGTAIVTFKMTTDKTAIVQAACETKNVWGCNDLYTGTEVIKGIGGTPIKIMVNYEQNETKTLKRATLPGIKINGGEESEMTEMRHRTVLYHFAELASLEEGFLIETEKANSIPYTVEDVSSHSGSNTIFVAESGWFRYSKFTHNVEYVGTASDIEILKYQEDEDAIIYSGEASLQYASEISFYKGDADNPPQFTWNVEYPVSNEGLASGGLFIEKGMDGVKWKVNKISDPKSIYKTEYLISFTLDAAEEIKKGDKIMKNLFGMDMDDMTNTIDPSQLEDNMFTARGGQTATVRILSPYPDD